jgi:c(7)-type cytochrome triheme protein
VKYLPGEKPGTESGKMERLKFKIVAIALLLIVVTALLSLESAFSHGDLKLPPLPAPEDYGDVLMNRLSAEKEGVIPVVFPHWVHRMKYTCRVCHDELEFALKANDTGVVCGNGEVKDKYCTICHNGKIAFAPKGDEGDNCKQCHNANASPNREKFFALQKSLPTAKFGNEIDWVKALDNGLIKPKASLSDGYQAIGMDKTLTLAAEMSGIPPAVFPHKAHVQWLDCSNCHPDIFNIKKKTTKHFSMSRILNGEFCGVCHLRIAFPLDECKKCHPSMRK